MSSRRLIIVDTEMGKVLGGGQTFLLRLVPELARRGWRTTVVCEPPEPPFAAELRAAGVDVATQVIRYPRIVEDSAKRLASWVDHEDPDAYVLSVSSGTGWAAMPLLRDHIPTLALVHSDDETFYRPLRHYRDATDLAVGVSPPIYHRLTADLHIPPRMAALAPYGIDKMSRHTTSAGALRVAYVGRLDEQDKQISVLAHAMVLLKAAPIDFTIAGDGPDASRFRQLLAAGTRARLVGRLAPEEALKVVGQNDCLVLTSRREGMPLAVLEARACGVVPVLSEIPAHLALVTHEVDGILVPLGDAKALADALRTLAADPRRLTRLADMSYLRAEKTTVQAMATAYESALGQAAEVRQSGGLRTPVPLMDTCLSKWPLPLRKLRSMTTSLLRTRGRQSVGDVLTSPRRPVR